MSSTSGENNNDQNSKPPLLMAPAEVNIVEVSPRDGLQNERDVVPSTKDKIELVKLLYRAGCNHIEAGSFVSSGQ